MEPMTFDGKKIAERVRQKRNTLKEVILFALFFLLFIYSLYISIKKIPNQKSKNKSVRRTRKSKKLWRIYNKSYRLKDEAK